MAKILILEPVPQVAARLADLLGKDGHEIQVETGDRLPKAEALQAELVLLSAKIKWTVCRPLFQALVAQETPVLLLTDDKQMVAHLKALYQGAAEVLLVPYTARALSQRVARLLARRSVPTELKLDENERVALLDGQRVELTAQEFALLLALMESPDAPLSREELLRKAWGYQSMGDTRTVDVHVQRLRKKLGCDRIETVYKCGYRLVLA